MLFYFLQIQNTIPFVNTWNTSVNRNQGVKHRIM